MAVVYDWFRRDHDGQRFYETPAPVGTYSEGDPFPNDPWATCKGSEPLDDRPGWLVYRFDTVPAECQPDVVVG